MTAPAKLSIEALFATPAFIRAQISPDGARIAWLAPWQGRLNIWVGEVAAPDAVPIRVTADAHRNIDGFSWTLDSAAILFVQDRDGDENWHLHRASIEGGEVRTTDLTPQPGVRVVGMTLSPDAPGKVLVQMNARRPDLIDLYEIDMATGERVTIAENPGDYHGWIVVPGAAPHILRINADGDHELGRHEDGGFVPVARFTGRDYPLGPLPLLATPDGKGMWTGSNRGSDRTRLVRVDLATGEEAEVDSHPTDDLDTPRPEADPRYPSSLIVNPATGALLGARYLGERQTIHALDPHFGDVLAAIRDLAPGEPGYLSGDAEGRRWVVEFTDDRHPGTSWLYDHATGAARVLGTRYPEIDIAQLAEVRPVSIRARDGLRLPCHLTLPIGADPVALPMVLVVHGGPWYRDSVCFDPEVQLLASHGYAVLQVNFRGSMGYGKAHVQAAIGEFAGRMHDDLIDALDWAIGEGIADPARVAIYGCSYGGYSALVGASFTPDRFAAAIDYSGMSDLRSLVDQAPAFVRPALANNYILFMGDPDIPEQNADMLARSPVSRLDQVEKPLLVIHGANDARVSLAQAETVVNALRERGAPVEFLLNETEGHWFINEDSNVELYHAIVDFLARHIGGSA